MDGFGYLKNDNGSYYQGYFKKGVASGFGISRKHDQKQGYSGWWEDGFYEGLGLEIIKINDSTVCVYNGEWKC